MLKKYFITGLMIWIPVVITLFFLRLILGLGDKFLASVPLALHPVSWLGLPLPGFGLLLLALVILCTGLFAKNMLGKRLVELWEALLSKVPFVRSIYYGVKRSLQVLFTTNKAFQQVVLVEYPRKGIWVIGFVTGETKGEVQSLNKETLINVFIPTTPNPTSGFLLFLPKKDLIYMKMKVEDAVKMVISGGIVTPEVKRIKKS